MLRSTPKYQRQEKGNDIPDGNRHLRGLSTYLSPSFFLHQTSLRTLAGALIIGFCFWKYGLKSAGFTLLPFFGSRMMFVTSAIRHEVCPHSSLPRASAMSRSSRSLNGAGSTPQMPEHSPTSRSIVPARRRVCLRTFRLPADPPASFSPELRSAGSRRGSSASPCASR